MMRYQERALKHLHACLTHRQLWMNSVRLIFSKTGIWTPKLSSGLRHEIETHWQPLLREYDKKQCELASSPQNPRKEKFYALSMFPYPSGNLHMGHIRVYTLSDVMARYQHLKGKMVIHPIGWDAFGLPAENAAIERGVRPKDWTYSNIERMRKQFKSMGFSFDWNRELATCDPAYYKWTQYIFLKMFENGLAFQQKGLVNWDPVDMTVLATEQIDDTGRSWRSGAKVVQKYLKQWYLRNTIFSESLLDGLSEVDPALWRDIILLQKNWISKLTGQRIEFKLVMVEDRKFVICLRHYLTSPYYSRIPNLSLAAQPDGSEETPLSVYTENLDLIYGVSHLSVALSHHLCVDLGIREKDQVLPVKCIHPFTGRHLSVVSVRDEDIVSKRNVMLGIPSVCDQDKQTAERLGLPVVEVLDSSGCQLINSQELTEMTRQEAMEKSCMKALELGVGGERISARLNDWLISRQRYWGTPIPIIHCPICKVVPVPYEDLPVELPDRDKLTAKDGKSPLAEDEKWLNVSCPKCGGPATRETDTMDTFVDSTWYFLRYLDPHNEHMPFDPEKVSKFTPVDLYVGGKEHAVLHLYFARFVHHFLYSIGLVNHREPFRDLLTQGMVKAMSYRIEETGQYFHVSDVDLTGEVPVVAATGQELVTEWDKMGKSLLNGINPEDVLSEFGVDSTRLCMLSNVAPQSDRNWCNTAFKGVLNWQSRIWSLVTRQRELALQQQTTGKTGQGQDGGGGDDGVIDVVDRDEWEKKIDSTRNLIINNVNFQYERTFNINSAISRLQSLVSWLLQVPPAVYRSSQAYERCLCDLVVMLSPMAPHFAAELWAGLRGVANHDTHQWDESVLGQRWPEIDDEFLMPLTLEINYVKMTEIGIPYKEFDQLTADLALEAVKKDRYFLDHFSAMTIKSSNFRAMEGHKAQINLNIPEYRLNQMEGKSTSEKKKQKKKMSKKKQKLHNM